MSLQEKAKEAAKLDQINNICELETMWLDPNCHKDCVIWNYVKALWVEKINLEGRVKKIETHLKLIKGNTEKALKYLDKRNG